MDNVLLIVVIGQLVIIAALFFAQQKRGQESDEKRLQSDISKLSDDIDKLREGLGNKLDTRLDKNQDMMLKSLQQQFSQSAKLISQVSANLSEIKESNKQVVSVTDELKTLQNTLQNPKQRGVLGEYYLQSVLENVLPPANFAMQYKFKDGSIVDAVVFLDKGKLLPIDSKFSLENYNRMIEEKSKDRREKLATSLKADLKLRIDETAKYIKPDEGTMDHAFMFIPSEAIYYDLLNESIGAISSRDLIEYAFRDKKVIIVSPTTFLAYLQTVIQGLRSLQIEQQAKEIQKNVGKLGQHIGTYETYMQKLGKSIGVTVSHYNDAHKELNKIDKDVIKIAGAKPQVEANQLERPQLED